MKGLDLCRDFFFDAAKPILDEHYPALLYSAGLIGYGSDVLGFDDTVSQDHMWGPRFYMFLGEDDIFKKQDIIKILSEQLPCRYKGYSVNFTEPDPRDNGVQHPKYIDTGPVNPLIFISTFDQFLIAELGTARLTELEPLDWLAFSEHRLLSIVSGTFFVDGLHLTEVISPLRYYPKEVKTYLIASNWDIIASEQAFVKRCGAYGDETGSMLICARIAERLMRLCFLYKNVYAPYSKWFGTAFQQLDIDSNIKRAIQAALYAQTTEERETHLVQAQALVADLHNASHITEPVEYHIESYFGRDIQVIFADKFSKRVSALLKGSPLEFMPLIGSLSQVGGLSAIADDAGYREQIKRLYG